MGIMSLKQAKADHGDHFQYNVSQCGRRHHLSLATSWAESLLHLALHQDHIPVEELFMSNLYHVIKDYSHSYAHQCFS